VGIDRRIVPTALTREEDLKKNQPLVSVVIPTYNRTEPTIRALCSVLAQTYTALDIIVIDDGSVPQHAQAVQMHVKEIQHTDPRIRYKYQTNKGQGAARNAGIAESTGEYIAFLDSDDTWEPEKIAWQVRVLQQFEAESAICVSDANLLHSSGAVTRALDAEGWRHDGQTGIVPDALRPLAKQFGGPWIQTLMIRSDVARQTGGFDPELRYQEDLDFFFRVALITKYSYVNLPLATISRVSAPEDALCRAWVDHDIRLQSSRRMLEKWLTLLSNGPDDVIRTVEHNLRSAYSKIGNWHLENRRYADARLALTTALKYQCTPALAVKWLLANITPGLARKLAPKTQPYL
jgi:glycosyltransferase involved in cell wall biosynthesis